MRGKLLIDQEVENVDRFMQSRKGLKEKVWGHLKIVR